MPRLSLGSAGPARRPALRRAAPRLLEGDLVDRAADLVDDRLGQLQSLLPLEALHRRHHPDHQQRYQQDQAHVLDRALTALAQKAGQPRLGHLQRELGPSEDCVHRIPPRVACAAILGAPASPNQPAMCRIRGVSVYAARAVRALIVTTSTRRPSARGWAALSRTKWRPFATSASGSSCSPSRSAPAPTCPPRRRTAAVGPRSRRGAIYSSPPIRPAGSSATTARSRSHIVPTPSCWSRPRSSRSECRTTSTR